MKDGVQKTNSLANSLNENRRNEMTMSRNQVDFQDAEVQNENSLGLGSGWKTILRYGKGTDEKTLDEWKDELANLLIFIGLFSAVLTGFIAMTLPILEEDSSETSAKLLARISQQLSSFSVSPAFVNSTVRPLDRESFRADNKVVKLNILWICSLTLSLMAAFFTISAQQWLRRIPLPSHLNSREAMRLRQLRYGGYLKWKIPEIISLLPVAVQISVVLFLAGLLLLLDYLDPSVARVFLILASILWGIWAILTILPLVWIDCPYQSPVIPVILATAQLCMPPVGAVIVLIFSYLFYILANPLQFLSRMALPVFVLGFILLKTAVGFGFAKHVSVTHHPLYMRTMGNIVARLEILGERLQLWAFYHALSFYASLSHSSSFWTNREHRAIYVRRNALDAAALAGAPLFVPREDLRSVQVECFEDIPHSMRPEFAMQCVEIRLELRHLSAFHLFRPRSASSFTGHYRDFHEVLFTVRDVLWDCLPKIWTSAGGVYTTGDPDPYPYDRTIGNLLCFLYRGTLFRSTRTTLHSVFMDDFAKALVATRNSLDNKEIIKHSIGRLPISMLFGCCHRASPLEIDETRSAVHWAIAFLSDLLEQFGRSEHLVTEIVRGMTQAKGVPLYEIPVYETALCACAIPLLSLNHSPDLSIRVDVSIREKMHTLLRGLDKFLAISFKDIAYLTQKISYLSDDSHMLMTMSAITAISSCLVTLARIGYVASNPNCASRNIARSLKQICATNVNGKLQTAEDSLVEFEEIWDDKWVFGFPS